jgi:hypothetical protein
VGETAARVVAPIQSALFVDGESLIRDEYVILRDMETQTEDSGFINFEALSSSNSSFNTAEEAIAGVNDIKEQNLHSVVHL